MASSVIPATASVISVASAVASAVTVTVASAVLGEALAKGQAEKERREDQDFCHPK